MSCSSTLTGLSVLILSSSIFLGINTQLCVDSNPHTGLTVLVECLTSSWSNKVPFLISFLDSCPPTGLPFLIIGFLVLVGFVGYLCCFQRLLNPIHSSSHVSRKSSVVVEVTHTGCFVRIGALGLRKGPNQ